ncbi:MAG: nickel pincer cofactor biosynthesis protein LarB [Synechococcus sp. SB0666_bin_14]|nr:nickel pincer cofactor biosynthesis protein LarB [Synechococcus sp. SB0666_bin_14]MYA90924.1 nickel pincer cofactor biosynthesis protein LarB [Synechococcus sp. SB0663_bin_10]MYG46359.1 nickel pincer cofactor biosynthesis protein LarB [Synechococcus sp. SB0675_bin_6]MYJ60332.1 nickel pincer cofactor biosynthesis protein LarB [Synechococcus sp. SB0672_bin_6]MYK90818.1 nickel pincer cofactor biosynthesis protein LarB [Synechococcus sp. SB0669_bin_8]
MTREDRGLNLDLDRRRRLGMVEAVWGADKTVDQIVAAAQRLRAAGETLLVTRVDEAKARVVRQQLPGLCYHPQARCITMGETMTGAPWQRLALLTGGSSDLPVAAEASVALACHGVEAELIADVGVAGLHRLMARLDHLTRFPVLIVCAGMEGSLPTVVAGLLPQPVIAVPVSVGYGVSTGGQVACMGMLASCAPGLCVVNIDNGYGAAMAALRILRMKADLPIAESRGSGSPS